MPGFLNLSITEQDIRIAAERVEQRCARLAGHSEDNGCLTRTFCSSAMASAHQELGDWMLDAGLQPDLDALGNLIGKPASATVKPILLIGSHLDTVVNAGRFDGTLGVLLGLGVFEVINQLATTLPFDIHVVAFSEEEGVRFRYPFIGSMGIAGVFDEVEFDRTDPTGKSMRQVLNEFGCKPDDFASANYGNKQLVGFIEAHIEQATRLEQANAAVGVVDSIAGQTRATVHIHGVAGHAGTVLHDQRKDALAAAAEIVLAVENQGRNTEGLYATVGTIKATPSLSNVICGESMLRLDLRHASDEVRESVWETLKQKIERIVDSRKLQFEFADVQHSTAIPMDPQLRTHLSEAMRETGTPQVHLISGAGHDAMIMAKLTRSCMLFVRCRNGVSHHPDEFVSLDDIRAALKVMVHATLRIAQSLDEWSN